MAYFSKTGNFLIPKNNLEKAVAELIKSNNRMIILDDEIEDFKNKILSQIKVLCEKFPRCKAPKYYFHGDYGNNGDFHFGGIDSITFHIYKAS